MFTNRVEAEHVNILLPNKKQMFKLQKTQELAAEVAVGRHHQKSFSNLLLFGL